MTRNSNPSRRRVRHHDAIRGRQEDRRTHHRRVCRDVSKALADANGVVVVPRSRAQEVAATARTIENTESDIRALIAQGKTLTEARAALGYHGLQRRQG